eukprot:Hpha_TRINITY_DN16297_c3_g4::TRINITY_DN16297_c3_g4_i4::g.15783::m.15783
MVVWGGDHDQALLVLLKERKNKKEKNLPLPFCTPPKVHLRLSSSFLPCDPLLSLFFLRSDSSGVFPDLLFASSSFALLLLTPVETGIGKGGVGGGRHAVQKKGVREGTPKRKSRTRSK